MLLDLSPAETAFQGEVRRFFAEDYPQDVLAKFAAGQRLTKADHIAAQAALNARGWLGVGWPGECGGTGWSPVERYLFDQELERAGAAPIIPMGVIYIGPIVCAFGTDEQKARWLPDILESRAFWAQGYSEPEAGSDLASLRFSAVREGDEYVLNGTKIWTSGAHWADWIFCLARTSREAKKQQGISLICAPLDAPGVIVHPIRLIDGSCELNRVEFVDVRVPVANRIGEEGQAWHYANVLLKTERLSYAHIGAKRRDLAQTRAVARTTPAGRGRTMAEEPAFALAAARVEARLDAIEAAVIRSLRGEITMAAAAALKIACTECAQAISELQIDLAGRNRAPMLDRDQPGWAHAAPRVTYFGPRAIQSYLWERAQTIYGGSSEVQKTIIWRTLQAGGEIDAGEAHSDPSLATLRRSARTLFAAGGDIWQALVSRMGVFEPGALDDVGASAVMEEAGRALSMEPLSEALVATWLLARCGGAEAERIAAGVRSGEGRAVLVWAEPDMRFDLTDIGLRAVAEGPGWRLDGAKALAIAAPVSDTLLVAACTAGEARGPDGLSLFAVPRGVAGLQEHAYRTIDGRAAADLTFDGVRLGKAALLGPPGAALPLLEEARDRALALQAAEAVGLMARMIEQTVDYTRTRRQFDRTLAEFQALQHRMVDMYLEAELARAAAWRAMRSLAAPPAERMRTVSAAHAVIAAACRFVGQQAVQLHGGIGMTDELPLGRYFRRATLIEAEWGDAGWHLARMVKLADEAPGA